MVSFLFWFWDSTNSDVGWYGCNYCNHRNWMMLDQIQINKENNEESMIGDGGYVIHNTHNINTSIDTDDNEG